MLCDKHFNYGTKIEWRRGLVFIDTVQ